MRAWRDAYSFGVVVLMIGLVSATAMVSCGSGDGETNGELCQQCGDSDGPCISGEVEITDRLPEFCEGVSPCTIELVCTRKVDSGQRRCFPADPDSGNLDFFYECDGSRPGLVPTATATGTPTPTATASITPTSTGPTTNATPTATPTAEPGPPEVAVDITIAADVDDENQLPANFTASVTYPGAKGNFLASGAADCEPEDDVAFADNGSGILTITFAFTGDDPTDIPTSIAPSCTFHQTAGEPLTKGDLGTQIDPDTLLITIDEPS